MTIDRADLESTAHELRRCSLFQDFSDNELARIVPLLEIARGALQSPLQRFLVGPYATALAIVIANALFTASHLYLSTTFALIALFLSRGLPTTPAVVEPAESQPAEVAAPEPA